MKKKEKETKTKIAFPPLHVINLLPMSSCDIKWSSNEASKYLDCHLSLGGPLRIEIYAD